MSTRKIEHRAYDIADLKAAAKQLFGRDDIADFENLDCPNIGEDQFANARKLAHSVHKLEFDNEFTLGGALETISLLISVEVLSAHVRGFDFESRQNLLNTVIAKALLHAKSLVDAYDRGEITPTAERVGDNVVPFSPPASSTTRH